MRLWYDVGRAIEDLMADQLHRDTWLIFEGERITRGEAKPMWWGPRWFTVRR